MVTWSIEILARSDLRGFQAKKKHVNICNGWGFLKLLMREKGERNKVFKYLDYVVCLYITEMQIICNTWQLMNELSRCVAVQCPDYVIMYHGDATGNIAMPKRKSCLLQILTSVNKTRRITY